MNTAKTFKGIDLLDKILEFVAMTPDENEWNYTALSHNEPRLVRLQQICSLLKAFSLTNDKNLCAKTSKYINHDLQQEIKSILKGDFIEERDIAKYDELFTFVRQYLKGINQSRFDKPISLHELWFIYPMMIDFKIKLLEIIKFNKGWLEISSPFSIFHVSLTHAVGASIDFKDLDYVLELLINPSQKTFSEQELIEHYGFPDEDLEMIDFENI